MCEQCVEACDINAIKLSADNTAFIYTIETDGAFSAQEIITRAAESLKTRAAGLGEVLENF